MKSIGFIGTGNMGSALAIAAARSKLSSRILLANRTREKAERLAEKIGGIAVDNRTAAEADILFLGVKPQFLEEMFADIKDVIENRDRRLIVVSMIAGKSIAFLEEMFKAPVVRIIPNMPIVTGNGTTLYAFPDNVKEEEKEYILKLLEPTGKLIEADEKLMSSAGGVTGCGPAFTAMFVEALSDGAVACGVPRKQAMVLAAEMLKGTAEYLLSTEVHPGVLKDSVCSPGGSTIQGVRVLEERGFRAALTDALIATYEKKF